MNQLKKIVAVLSLVVLTTVATAQKAIKNYIKKYESLALEKGDEHEIPASIILGVSIIESAAGKSLICKALNNFFGIKGKNWSSEKKMGYKSAYKEYKTDGESFEHFCQVLRKKKFYQKLKGKRNYKEWLNQMNKASYASAKEKWIDDITKTIEKYDLHKLDKQEKQDTASIEVTTASNK
ncbi:MAG TPA: glucosaminidase domain-containing protein [Flavisolibacter sp.]|jgi:flagellum-specific peptidoglycan hydrolase FlgJ